MRFASEDLMNEHEGILFGLQILEKVAGRFQKEQAVPEEDIHEMIDFLKLFADKCHHGKEEGFYFPVLESMGVPNENGPIGQMLLEHAQGRQLIADMSKAVSNGFLEEAFILAATGYITLLRTHISKENTVLFPLGDRLIPIPKQTELLESFETFEEEVMGAGTHEKLHAMLETFEAKYSG